jgi:hypothetical protein
MAASSVLISIAVGFGLLHTCLGKVIIVKDMFIFTIFLKKVVEMFS